MTSDPTTLPADDPYAIWQEARGKHVLVRNAISSYERELARKKGELEEAKQVETAAYRVLIDSLADLDPGEKA